MTNTTAVALSPDQQQAANAVCGWLDRRHSPDFSLGGYAGTGKSTLLNYLWPRLTNGGTRQVVVMAPTGKAASVLREKGIFARTIHQVIYLFKGTYVDDDDNEKPIFEDRDALSFISPDLLVCDEASMVNSQMYFDISNKRVPVLWIGDHGQLEPVGGDPGLMADPNVRLDKIHRQAATSAIIVAAHHVRQGVEPHRGMGNDREVYVKMGKQRESRIAEYALDRGIDQIIVAYNKTRHAVNLGARIARRLTGLIAVGDRMICLMNDYSQMIYNGQIATVTGILSETDELIFVSLELESGEVRHRVAMQKACIGNPDFKTSERINGALLFDYGYAITCHKSQGDSWGKVLVVDQPCQNWSMERWRYTAFTRAEKELHVFTR